MFIEQLAARSRLSIESMVVVWVGGSEMGRLSFLRRVPERASRELLFSGPQFARRKHDLKDCSRSFVAFNLHRTAMTLHDSHYGG